MIVVESGYNNGKYIISPTEDEMIELNQQIHAPVVYFARLMGLSFPDYIRMCNVKYGATIKNTNGGLFPSILFEKVKAEQLAKELTARHKLLIKER